MKVKTELADLKKGYFMEDIEENQLGIQSKVIRFSRIDLALDLCAF